MNKLDYFPIFHALDAQHRKIVSKLASEYPFNIEVIGSLFINQKYSEINIRKILENKIIGGI